MKYRVHNENNVSAIYTFHTYFKTKREAVAYANEIGENAIIERKIGSGWFSC